MTAPASSARTGMSPGIFVKATDRVVNRAVFFVNRARRARTSTVRASTPAVQAIAAPGLPCTSSVQPVRAACPSCTSRDTASTLDVLTCTSRCTTCTRGAIRCTSNVRPCTYSCMTFADAGQASTSSRPSMSSSVTVSTRFVHSIDASFTIITDAGQGIPRPLRPSIRHDPVGNVDVREIPADLLKMRADVTEVPATLTTCRLKFTTFTVEPLDSARDSREIPSVQTIRSSATNVHRGGVQTLRNTGFARARGFSPGSPTMERKALHLLRCTSHRAVRAGAAIGIATSLRTCTARRACRAPSHPACSSSEILLRYDGGGLETRSASTSRRRRSSSEGPGSRQSRPATR